MSIADNWKQFEKNWNKKFGQQELQFDEYNLLEPLITKEVKKTKTETDELVEKANFGQILGAVTKAGNPE